MQIKKPFITGLLVLVGFCLHIENTFALYSPNISRNVANIKSHILDAQAKNGTGDLLEAINTIKNNNRVQREGGYVSGISGEARVAQELIQEKTYNQAIQDPLSSLSMVFNLNLYQGEFISNCLRNEIWGLEKLRDVVGQEMLRSYLLNDPIHGALLKEDYLYLVTEIELLKKYGSNPNAIIQTTNAQGKTVPMSSNRYFFNTESSGPGAINMYTQKYFNSDLTGCPDGEFERSFEQVSNMWQTLKVLGSGQGSLWSTDGAAWGSIWEMAKANAKIRARQWIQSNQITFTLGREEGAVINSLVKANGWERFVGEAKTQVKIVQNMVGLVTPLFDAKNWRTDGQNTSGCVYYVQEEETFFDCQAPQLEQFKQCQADRDKAKSDGINCDRFKNLNERRSLSDVANEALNITGSNEEAKREATTAFVYSISLDSISEQNIISLDEELVMMNAAIQQGYEKYGVQGGGSIPSLTSEVNWIAKNQCVNK